MYSWLWRETSIDSKLFSTGNLRKWLFPKSSCSYWNSKPIFIVWHLGSQNDSTVDIFKRPVHEWMTTPPIWIHGDNPKLLVSGQGMLWDSFLGDGNHTPHTKKSLEISSNRWNSTLWPNFGCRPHNNDYCIWKSDSNPQTGPPTYPKKKNLRKADDHFSNSSNAWHFSTHQLTSHTSHPEIRNPSCWRLGRKI